jgi:hypothetical protein
LPVHCDVGTKKNSKGYKASWTGFKLHADVGDCCLPVSVALTAASLHDSQVAIRLMKLTSARVDYLYDLMDAAYDAQPIYAVSRSLGHVPIIDKNGRGREIIPLAPHEAARYKERMVAERFNSRLKEEFGGGNVMVRGAQKITLHLMFGEVVRGGVCPVSNELGSISSYEDQTARFHRLRLPLPSRCLMRTGHSYEFYKRLNLHPHISWLAISLPFNYLIQFRNQLVAQASRLCRRI